MKRGRAPVLPCDFAFEAKSPPAEVVIVPIFGAKSGAWERNSPRIVINSGFFEKHHCFFLEYPHNVHSLFALFQ
jgi:hypothetical protein